MTIIFDEIGETNEVPSTLTEVGSSGPTGTQPKRVAIIGHRLSTGTVAADVPFQVLGEASGDAGAGLGSQLGAMCRSYKALDPDSVVFAIGLDDAGAAVVASGSIKVAGTATAPGTLAVQFGGRTYRVNVATGDTGAATAAAVKAAVDADARSLVLAGTLATDTVPLTARWKGPSGNDIDLRTVSAPAGLTVTLVAMASGAGAPDISAALTAIAAADFDTVILGTSDSVALTALGVEMTRRYSAGVEMPGTAFYALKGSLATQLAAIASRNVRHLCAVTGGLSPTPPWTFAAEAAAQATRSYARDAGIPYSGLELPGCLAPATEDHFIHEERNQLLAAGVSTFDVMPDGRVTLERLVTENKTDAQGQADKKFHDVTTMRVIAEYRRMWRAQTKRFLQFKLIDDGTPIRPGIRALTPSAGKAFMDSFYEDYATTGNVQDAAGFAAKSKCERHDGDRNRLDFYHPMRVADIVVTLATRIEIL